MTGEQTVEILGELGYSESEIDAMLADGGAYQIDKSQFNK